MSNFIVPNTFIPGTKAKAQEVNENFVSVQEELNQKAEKFGNSTQTFSVAAATENNHAINKQQLETSLNDALEEVNNAISCIATPFTVEKGYTNSSGNPAYMSYSGGTLNFRVNSSSYGPIIAVPANNKPRFLVTSVNSIDMSSYANGSYNIFLNSEGNAYAYNNTVYIQKAAPTSPLNNTVFVNTSVFPITAKIYQNSSWIDFDDVYLGTVQVSNNAITSIVHRNFNDNGHNVNRQNQRVVETTYKSGTSWYRVWSDGWIEQGGYITNVQVSVTESFLKNFSNTNYTITIGGLCPNTSSLSSARAILLSNKTKTGFSIVEYSAPQIDCGWYACGY